MPGSGVRNVVHPLECIDSGAAGLVNRATQVGDRSATRNKPAGESQLRNVSQVQGRIRPPSGVETVGGGLRPRLSRQLSVRPGKAETGFVERSGGEHSSVGKRHQVIGPIVVQAKPGDISSTLSGGEWKEEVNTGTTVTGRQVVRIAKPMVDLYQKLIGAVALVRRRNELMVA